MHLIQKELFDATKFFYEYRDHYREMCELVEKIELYFNRVLEIIAGSPAEVVLWGANYNDMLTYPAYFEEEITPWLRKASKTLEARGKIVATHTDGENFGLMDLIRDCGAHVAARNAARAALRAGRPLAHARPTVPATRHRPARSAAADRQGPGAGAPGRRRLLATP